MRNTPVFRVVVTAALAIATPGNCSATAPAGTSIVLQARCAYTDAAGIPMPPAESGPLVLTVREARQWITQWLVNGPHYPGNGLLSLWWDAFQGEAYLSPHEGLVSRSRAWQSAATDRSGTLDFLRCFGSSRFTIGYAHAYVHSPVEQQALLLAGSDDGLRVYVNGRSVLCNGANRVMQTDADRAVISLKAGINRLLFKTTHWTGEWRLRAGIRADHKVTILSPPTEPAGGGVFYVRADAPDGGDGFGWGTALRDIQTAVDAAADAGGGQVWVAAGLYGRSICLKPYVQVYGGFAGFESTIDERDTSANLTVVRAGGAPYAVRGATDAVLDGIGVTGGSCGIYCDGDSPLVRGCDIYGNDTGVMATGQSSPGVFACRIYANMWYGVQCHYGSSACVRRSVIGGNDRLAVYCYRQSNAELSDCIIERNGLHGVFVEYSSPRVWNCTISDNGGYAIHSRASNVSVANSIVSRNGWAGGGAVAVMTGAPPVVRRSCFWDNGHEEFVGLASPVGLDGNIRADPSFAEPEIVSHCPEFWSSCVEAGDNSFVCGDVDIWGRRRIVRRTVDMGAVEAQ